MPDQHTGSVRLGMPHQTLAVREFGCDRLLQQDRQAGIDAGDGLLDVKLVTREDWLKIEVYTSGRQSLVFQEVGQIDLQARWCHVHLHPEGIAKGDWMAQGAIGTGLIVYLRPAYLRERLAETLDRLSDVIRERFKVKRQVRVLTAHGRITGWILAGLPPTLALAMFAMSPGHLKILTNDPLGVQMIVIALTLQVIGTLIIRKLVKIRY